MEPRKRNRKTETEQVRRLREELESELSGIAPLDHKTKELITAEGFANLYLRMVPLYRTQLDAYECLEEYHEKVMGRRRYSEFGSFRRVLNRYLKRCRHSRQQ